jgi:hypothetical protein
VLPVLPETELPEPELPELPAVPELEDEEEDPAVDVPDDPAPVDPVPVDVLLAPGCSRATTTPKKAASPAAPSTRRRVIRRTQASARSRLWGVFVWLGRDIVGLDLMARIAPHPSIPVWTLSQDLLWTCCDIVPDDPG